MRAKTKVGNSKQNTFLARRIAEEVDRFEMIVSDEKTESYVGNDPRTNTPLHIVFVNNTRSAGDGSYENPYSSLLMAQNNSQPGDSRR